MLKYGSQANFSQAGLPECPRPLSFPGPNLSSGGGSYFLVYLPHQMANSLKAETVVLS